MESLCPSTNKAAACFNWCHNPNTIFSFQTEAGAIGGTLMLKKSDSYIPIDENVEGDFETESSENGRWRF